MKNKINERSGHWMDLRVNNLENPFCFWNSVRTSSFLDKKGKSQVLFFEKKSSGKNSFSLSRLSGVVRVLPGVIKPSVEVCVWVRVSGSGRHRSWKVLDADDQEMDWSEQASTGTLWNEPRADELPNAPQLQGRSPDGFSQEVKLQHTALFFLPFALLALRSTKWLPSSVLMHSSENKYWAQLSPLADLSDELITR